MAIHLIPHEPYEGSLFPPMLLNAALGLVAAITARISIRFRVSRYVYYVYNPSLVLISVGSICVPLAFAGIEAGFRSSRRPVGVESSGRV